MSKSRIFFAAISTAIIAVSLNSCTKQVGMLPVVQVSECDTITYAKHVKPLMDTACLSCHGTTPLPGAPPLTNYAQVIANLSDVKSEVSAGTMPQNRALTDSEKKAFQCWFGNGNKE